MRRMKATALAVAIGAACLSSCAHRERLAKMAPIINFARDERICDGHGIHVRRGQAGYWVQDDGISGMPLIQYADVNVREECEAARTGHY